VISAIEEGFRASINHGSPLQNKRQQLLSTQPPHGGRCKDAVNGFKKRYISHIMRTNDMPQKEIARLLGLTEAHLSKLLHDFEIEH